MWNTDAFGFQESTDPIYKTIPFFLAIDQGVSYGIFLDNTWRSSFDFGRGERLAYSFGSEGGPLDYYFIYGPEPKQVVEDYAWLTGTPPLPPLWSLGYQQSRYTYTPESRLREIADRLRKDNIPADALWLDIDFQDRNRPFTVDPKTFPDMPKLLADLKAQHFHTIAITDLHVAKAPDQGYAPYDTGLAGNHFVHNPDGSVFTGVVWPGPSVFPDFTQQQSRAWWGTNYKQFVADGFAGFWNDMNEPSVFDGPGKTMPLTTVHRIEEPGFVTRTATHAEIHNVYGMQNSRGTYEGVLKLDPNERPFVMTRASYAGGQRYAVTWTGDNSATWNHLRMSTTMLGNLGLSGFAFAGADVGGFANSPQPALLTKWLELAAFQPIDRDHSAKGTADHEPWVNGPHDEAVARKFIETRYRLLPYLYTVAEETSRTGVPMIRPLFLEFPHATTDGHPVDLDAGGEFMFGPSLLIAPPAYPDTLDPYSLNLPGEGWFDFWTGKRMPDHPLRSRAESPLPGLARRKHHAIARGPGSDEGHQRQPHPAHRRRAPRLRPRRQHHPHAGPRAKHRRNPARPPRAPRLPRLEARLRLQRLHLSRRRPHLPLQARRISAHRVHLRKNRRRPPRENRRTPGKLLAMVEANRSRHLRLATDLSQRHRQRPTRRQPRKQRRSHRPRARAGKRLRQRTRRYQVIVAK